MRSVVELDDRLVVHGAFIVKIFGSLHAAHFIFACRHEQERCFDLRNPLRENSCLDRVSLKDTIYSDLVPLLVRVVSPMLHPERCIALKRELIRRPYLVEDLGVGLQSIELLRFLWGECNERSHKSHTCLKIGLLSRHHDLNTASQGVPDCEMWHICSTKLLIDLR